MVPLDGGGVPRAISPDPGPTARSRVDDVVDLPIGDYALLADGHTAALVSRAGSIDWWCPDRFDRPSAFARLLDRHGGHWSIRPIGEWTAERRYLADTFVLETRFHCPTGEIVLTDALVLETGARDHHIGVASPGVLVRSVECARGDVDVAVELMPRFGYGRAPAPGVAAVDGAVRFTSGDDQLDLRSDAGTGELDEATGAWRATLRLHAGQGNWFTLGARGSGDLTRDARTALADTAEAWRSWASHHRHDGWASAMVARSSLVLQALTYGPTGAMVAAPTTSLPEVVGGDANWDYRYAWLRDASIVLRALWVGTCPDEADRYFRWMAAAAGEWDDTPILFRVDGRDDLREVVVEALDGWRGSRPVRVGNEAAGQRQLDVPGHVLDAAATLAGHLDDADDRTRAFLADLADLAADHWRYPDSGIWEGREGERHYTSSKVMCWVALDRAVQLRTLLRADDERVRRWEHERDLVRDAILRDGWHEEVGAYTGAFGSDHLDASVLLMPIMGFLDATDPRMAVTIETIERELGDDGLVRRWTGAGDAPFVMCACWLAECHALAGDVDRAEAVLGRVIDHANDVGLLAEEIDPVSGELLGNYPQGLSHAALICAAATIDRARAPSAR